MTQEQKQRQPDTARDEEVAEAGQDLRDPEFDQAVTDLLDEIDGVLEENAEEFVNGYVQRGGE